MAWRVLASLPGNSDGISMSAPLPICLRISGRLDNNQLSRSVTNEVVH
jgi:hypothetical protein